MTDIANMPIRKLIEGLRKKAAELSDDHLITVLFSNAVVTRLEQEADRADACEKEERHWRHECRLETDKVNTLLECKPPVEALEQIADYLHAVNAPSDYVRALNEWADLGRKADKLLGSKGEQKTKGSSGKTSA